jgi:hypothetical protein
MIGATALSAVPGPAQTQTVLAKANAQHAPGVRVEVTELRRTGGNTLMLRMVIVNESNATFTPGAPERIYLLNPASKLKHKVAKDETGTCLCSRARAIQGKSRGELWAKFVAPPDDVRTLSIVIPKFATVAEVPVAQ